MAIVSDFQEEKVPHQQKPSSSSLSESSESLVGPYDEVLKQILDQRSPLAVMETVIDFLRRKSDLFKDKNVDEKISALVTSAKEKYTEVRKKKAEKRGLEEYGKPEKRLKESETVISSAEEKEVNEEAMKESKPDKEEALKNGKENARGMASNNRGKEQVNQNSQQQKSVDRADFASDPTKKKHFLELCLKEANKEGYRGVSLTPDSWKRLKLDFNKTWGTIYPHKVFKNQYDYLRADYQLWRKLVRLSGHGRSADINTINWPPQKWNEVLKKIPEAKKFRNKPLLDVEMLMGVFESTLAKGDSSCNPFSSVPRPTVRMQVDDPGPVEKCINLEDNDTCSDPFSGTDNTYFHGVCVEEMPDTPGMNSDRGSILLDERTSQDSRKKRRKSSDSGDTIEKQLETLVNIIKEQINEEKANKGPCFKDVNEVMKNLLKLGVVNSRTYHAAILKFAQLPALQQALMEAENEVERVQFLEFIVNN